MGAESFLQTLFHKKTDDSYILIWKKHTPDENGQELKLSAWFQNTEEAIKYCTGNGHPPADMYVGCGVSPKDFGEKRRCIASDISGIPAVWLDIDILDPAHKKPNLPENAEIAKTIIEAFPLKPTMVVHSGHGFQCWWVFDKFIAFTKPEFRTEISEFVHKFVWSMRDVARAKGYDLDMTFDLARVMRVPGSKNWKDPKHPVPVKLIENSGIFYEPKMFKDALEQFIIDLGDKATPIQPLAKKAYANQFVAGMTFILDPNAEPPKMKFDALLELDPKFKASWERDRKDFKDQSPSSYDMSLASFGFSNDWEPQEIVNLIIAWRRRHREDLKLREDYYIRTLTVASNVLEKKKIIEDLKNNEVEAQIAGEYRPEMLMTAKDKISDFLKVKVINIFKYPLDPVEYKLETAKGCIHLGPVNNLINQKEFQKKIVDCIGLYIDPMKQSDWGTIAKALVNSCVTVKLSEDTDNRGILKSWMIKYLQYQEVLYDRNDAGIHNKPFFEDKFLYIFLMSFMDFVNIHCKERKNPKEMGLMLRDFGFESLTTNFKTDIKYQSKVVWRYQFHRCSDIEFFVDKGMIDEQQKLYMEHRAEIKKSRSNPDDY